MDQYNLQVHSNQQGFSALAFLLVLLFLSSCATPESQKYYGVKIVDKDSGRGIPLVELKMLNALVYHTDNGGYIAFYEPGLMHQDLYFEIKSAGYHYPMDETGRQGVSLRVRPGRDTMLQMRRINIAERLYRITGTGKEVHQQALGILRKPGREQLVAGVLGQDSNLAAPFRGKIFWVWGDTFLPNQYRGNFSVSAAWTTDPRTAGWSAEDGIELNYFTDERGWSKPMIQLDGPGYVWFDFIITLPDEHGDEKLVAKYGRVNAYFGNYERGTAIFNEEKEIFEKYREEPAWIPQYNTTEHPTLVRVEDQEFYYLNSEFNFSRVLPSLKAVSDANEYEYFTCLLPSAKSDMQKPRVDRDVRGVIKYGWKKNTEAIKLEDQKKLEAAGILSEGEGLIQTVDLLTGESVDVSRGSIYWNDYRQRWVLIAGKQDIWYGEADTPIGPWVYLRKIAAHDQFLYNPVHYDFLDQMGGRRIYFEGTFTKFFSNEPAVPRYDYNQLMYAVNLEEPDLFLPVPVYRIKADEGSFYGLRQEAIRKPENIESLDFFALDRPVKNPAIVAIRTSTDGRLIRSDEPGEKALFYAIKADFSPDTLFRGLYEFKIGYKSFENATLLQLQKKKGIWQILPEKTSFYFSHVVVDGRSIQLDLEHEGDAYHLTGLLQPEGIDGTFYRQDKKSSAGTWSAERVDAVWWTPFSPHLVNLYEVKHEDGSYHYQITESAVEGSSISILCKVWKNPYEMMPFDFTAQPVQR